jgi:uncharacterized protein (TIGR02246 family)
MPTRTLGLLLPILFACSRPSTTDSYGAAPTGGEPNESAQRAVSQLEDQWAKALETHDTAFLAGVVAPDFRATGDSGVTFGRAELLRDVADTATTVRDVHDQGREVRIYGNGTVAVVTALGTWTVEKGEQTGQFSGRYTEVWVKRDGGWKVVTGHYTDVPQPGSHP